MLTPDEEVLLREIGILLLGNLAGFTAMTLVYDLSHILTMIAGVLVLLFCIACYKVANRGAKTRGGWLSFIGCFLAFSIATIYWCAYLASFATLVRGILVDTDIGPLDNGTGSFDGINQKNLRYIRMQNWTAQLLPMISNAVLVWRVHTIIPNKPWVVVAPIALLVGTIGSGFGLLGVMTSEDYNVVGVLGASKLWKDIFISYLSLSLATNVVCSVFISKEVARLQGDKGNIGATLKMSQVRVLSIILLESGILFAATQVINLALELVNPSPDSSLYFSAIVLTSVYNVCVAMYPTVAILLITVQRSIPHLYGQTAIDVKPSSSEKNASGARTATMGNLAFAPAVTQMGSEPTTTVQSPAIVSFVLSSHEKSRAQTIGVIHDEVKVQDEKQIKNVLDEILDLLGKDEQSLRKCALLSRTFLESSRKRLFSMISLRADLVGGKFTRAKVSRLLNVLSGNPSLRSYVRELFIYGIDYNTDSKLASILQMISQHGQLEIFVLQTENFNTDWSRFPDVLQQALTDVFKCPSLHTLHLANVCLAGKFPMSLLAPHIRRLSFYQDTFIEDQEIDLSSTFRMRETLAKPGELELLEVGLDNSVPLLEFLTSPESPFVLKNLRALTIHEGWTRNLQKIGELVDLVASTLQNFTWVNPLVDADAADRLGSISLRHMKRLRRLTLRVDLERDEEEPFFDFMASLDIPQNVKELVLICTDVALDGESVLLDNPISALDENLGALEQTLSNLQGIYIIGLLRPMLENDLDDFNSSERLPRLHATGKLVAAVRTIHDAEMVMRAFPLKGLAIRDR
ncbi:hypothetical protein H0H92_005878 [Tricholoma furcatifolium]|nr:hypothetical protein H0H92_005878 [Tricholoma furcatifolium]